jgi:hypothetical protein
MKFDEIVAELEAAEKLARQRFRGWLENWMTEWLRDNPERPWLTIDFDRDEDCDDLVRLTMSTEVGYEAGDGPDGAEPSYLVMGYGLGWSVTVFQDGRVERRTDEDELWEEKTE